MCSWITHQAAIAAHGKGVTDWLPLTRATVYYDHPVSAPLDHALIIDFANEDAGPGGRVSVELSAASAYALIDAVRSALEDGHAEHDVAPSARATVADGDVTGGSHAAPPASAV